jgi:hypothetical protein
LYLARARIVGSLKGPSGGYRDPASQTGYILETARIASEFLEVPSQWQTGRLGSALPTFEGRR